MKTYDTVLSFEYDFYKELYADGSKQRDRINSKFTPTITILTAEITAIIWFIFSAKKYTDKTKILFIIFAICLVIQSATVIMAVVNFVFCFFKYKFSYPEPLDTKKFIDKNKTRLDEYSDQEVLDNIIKTISDDYIKMAIKNMKGINQRSKYLNKCYVYIVRTLLIRFISFLFAFI